MQYCEDEYKSSVKVILFGTTGMVGSGVLKECLDDSRVTSILVVGRSTCLVKHKKLREVIHNDFFDYTLIKNKLDGYDACFFCLGVSAAGKSEAEYQRLTYDLTLTAGETLAELNPNLTFCYVSGLGTDSTEHGRITWARVKGKTENHLLRLPFKAAFMFRPGYIQPVKGVRSKTMLYRIFYLFLAPLYPVLRRLFPRQVTTTENIGRAMIRVAVDGYPNSVIDTQGINMLAVAD